jgi:hypothetical protein
MANIIYYLRTPLVLVYTHIIIGSIDIDGYLYIGLIITTNASFG